MSKYEIKYTTQFKKDYKLAKRRGLDITLLKDIVSKIANGEILDTKYKDHPLSPATGVVTENAIYNLIGCLCTILTTKF